MSRAGHQLTGFFLAKLAKARVLSIEQQTANASVPTESVSRLRYIEHECDNSAKHVCRCLTSVGFAHIRTHRRCAVLCCGYGAASCLRMRHDLRILVRFFKFTQSAARHRKKNWKIFIAKRFFFLIKMLICIFRFEFD